MSGPRARILLSELAGVSPADFELVVQTHARNLLDYKLHHDKIAAGSTEHQPYPAPSAPALVVRAIEPDALVPYYDLIDDGPTPEQKLRALRNEKLAAITAAENAAVEALMPPGKRRKAVLYELELLQLAQPDDPPHPHVVMMNELRKKQEQIERRAIDMMADVEDMDEAALKAFEPGSLA